MALKTPESALPRIIQLLSTELGARPQQVSAAVELLDEGATVPFIARYRKEVTGNLDDTQLRNLEERLIYLRELEERRAAVIDSITEQGKLTSELRAAIEACATKQALEDVYLPYKPKRRTRAQIAREAGLEPLAEALLADPQLDPKKEAERYVRVEGEGDTAINVPDVKAALDGARDILSERFAETADLLAKLRNRLRDNGSLKSAVVAGKEGAEEEKFRDYYAYTENFKAIPSHRALALFRGRHLGVLSLKLELDVPPDAAGPPKAPHPCAKMVADHFNIDDRGRAADRWLLDVCRWTWEVKAYPHLHTELMLELRERAETEAIKVFGRNLHELLLAAPAGPKVVMGIDPGVRTGCKVAVVDATGKLLETSTIYPHQPRNDWQGALKTLAAMVARHGVQLISIGNGTASRETDKLAGELIKAAKAAHPTLTKVVVSEAGASVYSASAFAAAEFPELDVSLRGAVSIARRLQDPLAELVKIDPKSIGVGQYQHDVNQRQLAKTLESTVEDCVNAVGVDANTASVPLLARVSGLNSALAGAIVQYRDANGPFANRNTLRNVPRLGEKTFEQAAGFLRIGNGDNPLDRSAVHPEAYPVVERILARIGKGIEAVVGHPEVLKGLSPAEFADERFGTPTVRDILLELEKPGRDPRPEFRAATFQEGVESLADLRPDMILEGVVTNVAAFGAFVDIGVHQDGLVHVSALADRFVKDPHEVVKAGQIVKVRVLEVDLKRQRIALSMRSQASAPKGGVNPGADLRARKNPQPQRDAPPATAMALALAKLRQKN